MVNLLANKKGFWTMKKWMIVVLAALVLAACSDKNNANEGNSEGAATNEGSQVDQNEDSNQTSEEEHRNIYKMDETAVITSDLYDFDYEVTVTDFTITDEIDGVSIFDYVRGLEESDPTRFAVVDVTIKNSSDEAYVPSEMFSANFSDVDQEAGVTSELDFSKELDRELAPGEEVDTQIVYTFEVEDQEAFWFKYEIMSDEETIFELPNKEK